jgi:hypothetical protein
MAELITMKVTPEALKLLRIIAAHTEETQYQVLERLLTKELERIEKRRENQKPKHPVTRVTGHTKRATPARKR